MNRIRWAIMFAATLVLVGLSAIAVLDPFGRKRVRERATPGSQASASLRVMRSQGSFPELPEEGELMSSALAVHLDAPAFERASQSLVSLVAMQETLIKEALRSNAVGTITVPVRSDSVGLAVVAPGCQWRVIRTGVVIPETVTLEPGGELRVRVQGGSDVRVFARSVETSEVLQFPDPNEEGVSSIIGLSDGEYQIGWGSQTRDLSWQPPILLLPGSAQITVPEVIDASIRVSGSVEYPQDFDRRLGARSLSITGLASDRSSVTVEVELVHDAAGHWKYEAVLPRVGYYRLEDMASSCVFVTHFAANPSVFDLKIPTISKVRIRLVSARSGAGVEDARIMSFAAPIVDGAGELASVGYPGASGSNLPPADRVDDGRYELRAPAGRYVVMIVSEGFELFRRQLTLDSTCTREETFYLKPIR